MKLRYLFLFLILGLMFIPSVYAMTDEDVAKGWPWSRMISVVWAGNAMCAPTGFTEQQCKDKINNTIQLLQDYQADAAAIKVDGVYFLAERYPNMPCSGTGVNIWNPKNPDGFYNCSKATFNDLDNRARWDYLNWTTKRFVEEGIDPILFVEFEKAEENSPKQASRVVFGNDYFVKTSLNSTKKNRVDMAYPNVRNFAIDMTSWIANNHPYVKGIRFEEPGYWMLTGVYPNDYPDVSRRGQPRCNYYGNCESWSQPILDYIYATKGYIPSPTSNTPPYRIWDHNYSKPVGGESVQNDMIEAMAHMYDLNFEGIRNNITRQYPDFIIFSELQRVTFNDMTNTLDHRTLAINVTKHSENRWVDAVSSSVGGTGGGAPKETYCKEYKVLDDMTSNVLITVIVSITQSGINNIYAAEQIDYTRTCYPNTIERIYEFGMIPVVGSINPDNTSGPLISVASYLKSHLPLPPYAILSASSVSLPIFSLPGGNYSGAQNVTISTSTTGATIRYTKDGTTPTESSPIFSKPIVISSNTTLKAKAWKTGLNASGVTTVTYAFGTQVLSSIVVNISRISTIKIDGDLNDWAGVSAVSFNGASGRGAADNTAIAKTAWNDNYLFFAFDVKDTNLQAVETSRDGAISRDDEVEVYIDTLNNRGSLMMPDDYHFLVNLNNAIGDQKGTGGQGTWQDLVNWNSSMISRVKITGTQGDASDVDTGYTVEIAIPWSDIGGKPAIGTTIGLDLAVGDRDNAADGYQAFDWSNISGTWANPDKWGDATLISPTYNYDVNGDGVVNREDLAIIGFELIYGTSDMFPGSDFNADGIVDVFDLVVVSNNIK